MNHVSMTHWLTTTTLYLFESKLSPKRMFSLRVTLSTHGSWLTYAQEPSLVTWPDVRRSCPKAARSNAVLPDPTRPQTPISWPYTNHKPLHTIVISTLNNTVKLQSTPHFPHVFSAPGHSEFIFVCKYISYTFKIRYCGYCHYCYYH